MKNILIFIFPLLVFQPLQSQEEHKVFSLNGYITSMHTVMFDSLSGPFVNDNLLHNRLNLNVSAGGHLSFGVELRNRLLTGDMIESSRLYGEMIDLDQGAADLSWNLISKESFILNTTVDRIWIDLNYGRFQTRIGRQRINWGQAFVWNPNDIFNTYSFFDFDYVERPGSDAVRFQYFPSSSSTAEIAIKMNNNNEITFAGLYRFNRWGYDIQFLAGYVDNNDIVLGSGWSGALGSFSIRGEGSLFWPAEDFPVSNGKVLLTAGLDRIFKDNSMAQLQAMYCNSPLELSSFAGLYSGSLSSKDLAFSEFTVFGQYTWAVNPLFNISVSAMWFPDLDGYFTGPAIDYSVAENVDFSLIWQHFKSVINGSKTRVNLAFLRFKYSF